MGNIESIASLSGSLSLMVIETTEGADYNKLTNLPTINGVVLEGDLTAKDLGIERGYDAQVDESDPEHLILST